MELVAPDTFFYYGTQTERIRSTMGLLFVPMMTFPQHRSHTLKYCVGHKVLFMILAS